MTHMYFAIVDRRTTSSVNTLDIFFSSVASRLVAVISSDRPSVCTRCSFFFRLALHMSMERISGCYVCGQWRGMCIRVCGYYAGGVAGLLGLGLGSGFWVVCNRKTIFFSFLFECMIMWVGCLQSQCVRGLESSFRLASLLATSRYRYYACSDAFRGVGRSFIHHGWSGVLVLISARCCSCIAVVVDYQCCTTAIERYWVIAHAV
jgi:hypothetical protein